MKQLSLVFFVVLSLTTFAQNRIVFLDKHGRWLPDEEGAFFYSVKDKNSHLYKSACLFHFKRST